jgi:LPXTG-motif cell wall-anchored protein
MWDVALSFGLMVGVLTLGVVGADSASAYPDQSCQILVNKQVVHPGDALRVTGLFSTSTDDGLEVHWRVTFNGEVVRMVGHTFRHTFRIPAVQKRTVLTLRAVATNGVVTCDPSADIVILPLGVSSTPDSSLPDTGAPSLFLASLGALCLAMGAIALRAGRRRAYRSLIRT